MLFGHYFTQNHIFKDIKTLIIFQVMQGFKRFKVVRITIKKNKITLNYI